MELKNWFIVTTKPQREGEAVADMARLALFAFLPMCRAEAFDRIKRTRTIRRIPVFRGYCFVAAQDESDLGAMRGAKNVTGILGMDGKPYRMPEIQLLAVINGAREGLFDEKTCNENKGFAVGEDVRIKVGALVGEVGRVVSEKGRRLKLDMQNLFGVLGQIKIDVDDVEKAA